MNNVRLYVNNMIYSGWETVRITRSLEAVAGSFEVSYAQKWDTNLEPWPIFRDDEVVVKIGRDTVVTGYVDDTDVSLDATQHSFSVSGRDMTCDLVDCSALNRPGEWRHRHLEHIARDLCAVYGIVVDCDVDTGAEFPVYRIQPGETAFEALERAARGRGVLLSGTPEGHLLITRSGAMRTGVTLTEGTNILGCSFRTSSAERYSNYIVEGQGDGQEKAAHTIRATAVDPGVGRFRVTTIMAEDATTYAYAQKRAQWEACVRAARCQGATVAVQGWRDQSGKLWAVNRLVNVDCPSCRLVGEYLISELSYTLDDQSGTRTELTLKRPDIYLAEPVMPEKKEMSKRKKSTKKASEQAKIEAL